MSNPTNLIEHINAAVAEVAAARSIYGDDAVDSEILPKHEALIQSLVDLHAAGRPLPILMPRKKPPVLIQPVGPEFPIHPVSFGSFADGGGNKGGNYYNGPNPSEIIALRYNDVGFGDLNGGVTRDASLLSRYINAANHALMISSGAHFPQVVNGIIIGKNLNQSEASMLNSYLPLVAADLLNLSYVSSTNTIQAQLNTVLASLKSQHDNLAAQLQAQHDAVTSQINGLKAQAAGNTSAMAQLTTYQQQADTALSTGLAGLLTDYNNAVALANSQAQQQVNIINSNLTDLVAVQSILDVQNQLSSLLLQPVPPPATTTATTPPPAAGTTAAPTVPYPNPTFNAPAPPYPITGFSPEWDTTYGVWKANIYDYTTGASALCYIASPNGHWINNSTGNQVGGPPTQVPVVTPTPTAPPPVISSPTSVASPAYSTPPSSAGPQSTYYTDSSGNVWVSDPVTGQWTEYSTGSNQNTLPVDYNMFALPLPATSTASDPSLVAPTPVVYDSGSFDLFGWLDSFFGLAPAVAVAPAPATTLTPSTSPVSSTTPNDNFYYPPPQGDSWGSPFGCSACEQPDCSGCMGTKSTVDRINKMPVVPFSSVSAFGDWSTLATSLITAVGTLGGAAISAALAPSVSQATQQQQQQYQPVIQQPAPATNYTPWLIGGGIAFGALMLVMMKKGRKD